MKIIVPASIPSHPEVSVSRWFEKEIVMAKESDNLDIDATIDDHLILNVGE